MPVLHDYRCSNCSLIEERWDSEVPECIQCGAIMGKVFLKMNIDSWGGPRYITSLDQTFDSKSDLKTYLKDNGLVQSPTAERHGGAYPIEAPRESRIYHDPKAKSSKSKGTDKRLSEARLK